MDGKRNVTEWQKDVIQFGWAKGHPVKMAKYASVSRLTVIRIYKQ